MTSTSSQPDPNVNPYTHAPGMPALKGGDGSGPGWDAVTMAASRAHPGQKPVLLQEMADPRARGIGANAPGGGGEVLDAVAIYREMEPFSHWHYISYGLTDLYGDGLEEVGGANLSGADGASSGAAEGASSGSADESAGRDAPHSDRGPSGLGAELTFRLADPGAFDPGAQPPMWPVELLHKLARWVITQERPIVPGDILDLGSAPIDGDPHTRLTGFLATSDPQLEHVDTPAGHVDFVQLVGATAQDLADAKAWHVQGLVDLFSEVMGLGLTDVTRPSVRALPGFAERVEQGIAEAKCGPTPR